MRECLADQQFQRGIIVDVIANNHPAMTMVGVLAHADVGDYRESGHMLLDLANRALHRTLVVPGLGALRVLVLRNPEQNDCRNAGRMGFTRRAQRVFDRHLRHPRHRPDLPVYAATRADKIGLNQIVRRETRFPYHSAQRFIAAQPAWPTYRKCHGRLPLEDTESSPSPLLQKSGESQSQDYINPQPRGGSALKSHQSGYLPCT